jgi:hypothetical protein
VIKQKYVIKINKLSTHTTGSRATKREMKTHETGVLREEEVGTLHNELEARLGTSIGSFDRGKLINVGHIDGLGATTAWHKHIRSEQRMQMERVSELHSILNTGLNDKYIVFKQKRAIKQISKIK